MFGKNNEFKMLINIIHDGQTVYCTVTDPGMALQMYGGDNNFINLRIEGEETLTVKKSTAGNPIVNMYLEIRKVFFSKGNEKVALKKAEKESPISLYIIMKHIMIDYDDIINHPFAKYNLMEKELLMKTFKQLHNKLNPKLKYDDITFPNPTAFKSKRKFDLDDVEAISEENQKKIVKAASQSEKHDISSLF